MKNQRISSSLLVVSVAALITACGGPEPQPTIENPPPVQTPIMKRETMVATTEVIQNRPIPLRDAVRVTVSQPPPPPREETIPPPPSSSQVWIPGYWILNKGWQWQAGHFAQPPGHASTWVPGRWVQQGAHWVWSPGQWR